MALLHSFTASVMAKFAKNLPVETEKKPEEYIYWSGVGDGYLDANGKFVGNFPSLRQYQVSHEWTSPSRY
ncbi:MAG: hypothetical protein Q7S19_03845 [bacterium]|nr:hypothetical protein [bacterium]